MPTLRRVRVNLIPWVWAQVLSHGMGKMLLKKISWWGLQVYLLRASVLSKICLSNIAAFPSASHRAPVHTH